MSSILSGDTRTIAIGEIRDMAISYIPKLKPLGTNPETYQALTGTPTITASPSGLTLTNKQVSTTALIINGKSVPLGNAVALTVSAVGATAGTYVITAKASTASETDLQVQCTLIVE
jgi:hypothetical protein